MKISFPVTLFALLLSFSQSAKAGINGSINSLPKMISGINKPDTGIAPNYSDLNTFWNDFKKYAQAKDIAKLATMTYFKFMNQNNMLSKQEFLKDFSFQRSALKALAKARPPKYNGTKKSDFDTNKYLGKSYTAIAGGALLTFCKIRGQWKFTGVNYGE